MQPSIVGQYEYCKYAKSMKKHSVKMLLLSQNYFFFLIKPQKIYFSTVPILGRNKNNLL